MTDLYIKYLKVYIKCSFITILFAGCDKLFTASSIPNSDEDIIRFENKTDDDFVESALSGNIESQKKVIQEFYKIKNKKNAIKVWKLTSKDIIESLYKSHDGNKAQFTRLCVENLSLFDMPKIKKDNALKFSNETDCNDYKYGINGMPVDFKKYSACAVFKNDPIGISESFYNGWIGERSKKRAISTLCLHEWKYFDESAFSMLKGIIEKEMEVIDFCDHAYTNVEINMCNSYKNEIKYNKVKDVLKSENSSLEKLMESFKVFSDKLPLAIYGGCGRLLIYEDEFESFILDDFENILLKAIKNGIIPQKQLLIDKSRYHKIKQKFYDIVKKRHDQCRFSTHNDIVDFEKSENNFRKNLDEYYKEKNPDRHIQDFEKFINGYIVSLLNLNEESTLFSFSPTFKCEVAGYKYKDHEKLICTNMFLSELDINLNNRFKLIKNDKMTVAQRSWLKKIESELAEMPDGTADIERIRLLIKLYSSRLAEFKNIK